MWEKDALPLLAKPYYEEKAFGIFIEGDFRSYKRKKVEEN